MYNSNYWVIYKKWGPMKKRIINGIFCILLVSLSFQSLPVIATNDLSIIGIDNTSLEQTDKIPPELKRTEPSLDMISNKPNAFDEEHYLEMRHYERERLYQEHMSDFGINYSSKPYTESEGREYTPPTDEVIAETQEQARSFDCSTVIDVPQIECEALVALYESTNGAGWTNNTGWLTLTTVGNWFGITIYSGNVLYIDISENQLIGTLPSNLGDLKNLTRLFLDHNQISGNIPPNLGKLSNLEQLFLDSNYLDGNIPAEIGNLNNLVYLVIDDNNLDGTIPKELSNLRNLYMLHLNDNQLSGSIPIEFENLSQLWRLSLSNNMLTGSIPPELGNISNLGQLYLSGNMIWGGIPPELCNLSHLIHLILSNTQLSGEIPSEMGNLVNLKLLNLNSTQLSGEIPSELGNLRDLYQLLLYDTQLQGPIPLSFLHLDKLDNFKFYNTQICEPSTPEFLAWKATVNDWQGTGIVCVQNLVSGRIVDSNNEGIAFCNVKSSFGNGTESDADGFYTLSLPDATHTLSASKAGYIFYPNVLTVNVTSDKTNQNFLGEIAYCAPDNTRVDSDICQAPLAEPFLSLPLVTTSSTKVFLQDTDNNGGRVDTWFDHDKPTYYDDIDDSITIYDGIRRNDLYKKVIGLGCFNRRCYEGHPAIDISFYNNDEKLEKAVNEKNIISAAEGKVLEICYADSEENPCTQSPDLGRYIIISHLDNRYATLYAHLYSIDSGIYEGKEVAEGELLGVMGGSGGNPANNNAFNEHLHFQVFFNQDWENEWAPSLSDVVDPFGWTEDEDKVDSWGIPSVWLWLDYQPQNVIVCSDPETISLGDVSLDIPSDSGYENQLISLFPTSFIRFFSIFRSLGVPFGINLRNLLHLDSNSKIESAKDIYRTSTPLTVSIDYSDINPHLDASQVSLHKYDPLVDNWIAETTNLDDVNSIASAEVQPDGYFDLQAPLICVNDITEPYDDKLSRKNLVDSNQQEVTFTRWFDIQEDVDWFSIYGFTGITYTINTLNLSDGVDTELSVYLPDGETLIAYDDNSGDGFASYISFVAPEDGIYYIKVSKTETSAYGCESSYEIHISPIHQAPIADAGEDQNVDSGALVTLDGSGSYDPDEDTPITYEWTQISGTSVTLTGSDTANPTFIAENQSTSLAFSLFVTDSLGMISNPDTVTITVIGDDHHQFIPLILR